MKFGPVALAQAEGAILAHSLKLPGSSGVRRLKKGLRLSAADLAVLAEAGFDEVTVARLDDTDLGEDAAASAIGLALAPDPEALGLTRSEPFTGRLNLYAEGLGVLRVDAETVARVNALDEAVTLATLDDFARVAPRQMVATVKIIPYAAPRRAVEAAAQILQSAGSVLQVHAPLVASAGLVLTRTPGMADKVVAKGADAVRARLTGLGLTLADEVVVPHETGALVEALAGLGGEMALVLTGSATSDREDVGPAAVRRAGGEVIRFGMPVDPGNLLFHGSLGGKPVIGLPGCARSPKLNGADWVLERLVCGIEVTAQDITAMGVGGLLKEIPSRPAPRAGEVETASDADTGTARRPRVSAVLLAAGSSSRMGARDKLLEPVAGQPLLARSAAMLRTSGADEVVVVLRPDDDARRNALAGVGSLRIVENPRAAEGMGTSIAAGVAAIDPACDAALMMLADMPEVTAQDIDRMIAAFDPAEGRAIVRAVSGDGRPGHPVLFGRRFFELLRLLEGDRGARDLLRDHQDFLVDLPLPGTAALTDLDTPEDWDQWRRAQEGEVARRA